MQPDSGREMISQYVSDTMTDKTKDERLRTRRERSRDGRIVLPNGRWGVTDYFGLARPRRRYDIRRMLSLMGRGVIRVRFENAQVKRIGRTRGETDTYSPRKVVPDE